MKHKSGSCVKRNKGTFGKESCRNLSGRRLACRYGSVRSGSDRGILRSLSGCKVHGPVVVFLFVPALIPSDNFSLFVK